MIYRQSSEYVITKYKKGIKWKNAIRNSKWYKKAKTIW